MSENKPVPTVSSLIADARARGRIVSGALEDVLLERGRTVEQARSLLATAPANPHQPLSADARRTVSARLDVLTAASSGRSMTDDEQSEFDDLIAKLDARAETAPKLPTPPPAPAQAPEIAAAFEEGRSMARTDAAAIAKVCCDAGVPEVMATIYESATSTADAAERIAAAQTAKKIVPFPQTRATQPDPNREPATAATVQDDILRHLVRAGANPFSDWSEREAS